MQDEYEDETLTIGVAVDKHSNSRTRGRRNDERWESQSLGTGGWVSNERRGEYLYLSGFRDVGINKEPCMFGSRPPLAVVVSLQSSLFLLSWCIVL